MKTKRRHDLQTNELADWIGTQIEAVKPYSQYIVGGAIAIALVIGLFIMTTSQQRQKKEEAWNDYFAAIHERSPDKLAKVAQNHPTTVAAQWASQVAGNIYLNEGISELTSDRETAVETLEKAKKSFEAVLKSSDVKPLLRQKAQFGLAQVYESLGEIEDAKKYYKQVAEAAGEGAFGRLATDGITRLEDPSAPDFYELLATYKPPPPDTGSMTVEDPDPLAEFPDLPRRPDLSFPGDDSETASSSDFVPPKDDSENAESTESSEGGGTKTPAKSETDEESDGTPPSKDSGS